MSWIVSLLFLGTIIGCLTGGPLNHKLGPRRFFLCCAPIAALTWVMIALSHRVWVVYLARIMSGFLFGTFQANGKVYNAEIAHPDLELWYPTWLLLELSTLLSWVTSYCLGGLLHGCLYFLPFSFWLQSFLLQTLLTGCWKSEVKKRQENLSKY